MFNNTSLETNDASQDQNSDVDERTRQAILAEDPE